MFEDHRPAKTLPDGTILDGETVVLVDSVCVFRAMAIRGQNRRAAETLAQHTPATYIAFDIVAHQGEDRRARPWERRRQTLENTIDETEDNLNHPGFGRGLVY